MLSALTAVLALASLGSATAPASPPALDDEPGRVLVWNLDGGRCASALMTRVESGVWRQRILVTAPHPARMGRRIYFKFMIDAAWTAPHYGRDRFRALGVVLAENPPAIVREADTDGYCTIQLNEIDMTYAVSGGPGSMDVQVMFGDTDAEPPPSVLEHTQANVLDVTEAAQVGIYRLETTGRVIRIRNLLPGREYRLRVRAPGYASAVVDQFLTEAEHPRLKVTLARLVPVTAASWGRFKALYKDRTR
jgi:hypothetical protein